MAATPAKAASPVTPAEMQAMVARAGLTLNPGQMADLVLAWRQLSALIAAIPRDRPLADDQAYVFRLPPPSITVPKTRSPCASQAMSGVPETPPLTIARASRLIASRKLSPLELTRALLERIQALNPELNAFITVTERQALAAARAAARGTRKGPLAGIPVGYKDIYNTAGVLTTGHSKLLADNVPTEDAEAVRRLSAAGIVMLGKLATHEFAVGGPAFDLPWPPARNPWDLRRYTGGSSSGSGAAVAAGLVLGALGSDTGGSIRLPAAYCGIAGLKPTPGLVSRRGVIPLAPSLDTVVRWPGQRRIARCCWRQWPAMIRPTRRLSPCHACPMCAGWTRR